VQEALKRSMLGRALMSASGSFLPGMSTYLLKLGPGNLGADAEEIDLRIAASFPAYSVRIRLQDIALLIADGLTARMKEGPARPVCLANIAGGAAADSWNALICLNQLDSTLLANRSIAIAVLDLDASGPAFGRRALEALQAEKQPLHGLAIDFSARFYDWRETATLSAALAELNATRAACAISSEGGLFEYGSDEEIAANLAELHRGTALDAFVVGSVTRDCEAVRSTQTRSRIPTRPRSLDAFRLLAASAGWVVEQAMERTFSYHVRMVKR
jgi:hypothetical protein